MINALDLMKNLSKLKELEGSTKWVTCPLCGDEVSKLRPCSYYENDFSNLIVSHACVECTETTKGLLFFSQKLPIPGVVVIGELLPVYRKLHPKYVGERSYFATVAYGDWKFTVWASGPHLSVLEKGKTPDQAKSFDNVFQLWFFLKHTLETGLVVKEETPWG